MTNSIVKHEYNGFNIFQQQDNGYVNLNQMADAEGKRIDNWARLESTKELIAEFERQQNGDTSDLRYHHKPLVTVKGSGKGSQTGGGGTWAHPLIAIQFAQWCSSAFALQVSCWVYDWMTTGGTPQLENDENIEINQILQVVKVLEKTGNEERAKEFAYENLKNLYPDLIFPSSNRRKHYQIDKRTGERLLTASEQYVLKRITKASESCKGVSTKTLYQAFRTSKSLPDKTIRETKELLIDMNNRGLIHYDRDEDTIFWHNPN